MICFFLGRERFSVEKWEGNGTLLLSCVWDETDKERDAGKGKDSADKVKVIRVATSMNQNK